MWWRLGLLVALVPVSVATAVEPPECLPVPYTVTTDAAGARWYHYIDGATQVLPPPGFDPRTAPVEQLDRYGFDTRPGAYPNYRGTVVGLCVAWNESVRYGRA